MSLKQRINSLLHSVKYLKRGPRFIRVCYTAEQVAEAKKEIAALPFNPCRLRPKIIQIKKVDMSVQGSIRYDKEAK